MSRKSLLDVLLDVLVFAGAMAIFLVVLGYAMDLSAGRPQNELMDRIVIGGAFAFILVLVVWYFRSGQARYDWNKEDKNDDSI